MDALIFPISLVAFIAWLVWLSWKNTNGFKDWFDDGK